MRIRDREGRIVKNFRPRVLIADGHAMFAEALRAFLAKTCEVVGIVGEGPALLDTAARLTPDVVVLDVGMKLTDGLTACAALRARYPSMKLVCLTEHGDAAQAVDEFRNGASAFLLKSSTATELLTAIREATKDRTYISPLIAKEVLAGLLEPGSRKSDEPHLTSRQIEVLRLLAQGKSMKMAAEVLHISTRTVQFHKYEMMKILQLKTNADIIQYAIKRGMIA
jgi:DNA-binding NarL/FixJ family response regulator